jgi:hypothetical protein
MPNMKQIYFASVLNLALLATAIAQESSSAYHCSVQYPNL